MQPDKVNEEGLETDPLNANLKVSNFPLDIEEENTNISIRYGWGYIMFPYWVVQLYLYELDQLYPPYSKRNIERTKITLAGITNPNPEKYINVNININMKDIKMTKYMLRGVATIEDLVEFEITDVENADLEDLKARAEKEFLQTHPNYEYVEWVGDPLAD